MVGIISNRNSKKRIMLYTKIVVIVMLFFSINMIGQSTINSTGENYTTANGSVSFSVGQIDYLVKSDSNHTISEGVQQPIEISVLSVQDQLYDKNIAVYPNPTFEYINLTFDINDANFKKLRYILLDTNGKLIMQKDITKSLVKIDISNLTSAVYYLKVLDENKDVKVFKIMKR